MAVYVTAAAAALCVVAAIWSLRIGTPTAEPKKAAPVAKLAVPLRLLNPIEAVPNPIPDLKQSIPGAELGERMMRTLSGAVRAVTPAKAAETKPGLGQT
jgi:hypothetical protein